MCEKTIKQNDLIILKLQELAKQNVDLAKQNVKIRTSQKYIEKEIKSNKDQNITDHAEIKKTNEFNNERITILEAFKNKTVGIVMAASAGGTAVGVLVGLIIQFIKK